ncbi:MAG: hypothetical protein QOJ39_1680 [Candidatus Eremiobacteraeota bacterium]|nr:hypothetical protein [Candidatus Eremiobacteraeota bacterium]
MKGPETGNTLEPIVVVAKAPQGTSPADVIAAFRSLGDAQPLEANRFRFEWSPVLLPFAGHHETAARTASDSVVIASAHGWRWELDAGPLTTGRVLWRMANALRLLTLLSLLVEKSAAESWCALYRGKVLAANDGSTSGHATVVTEDLAELVGGASGKIAYRASRQERLFSFGDEDEATLASERNSMLIATFIEDQLAVRSPITQAEIDGLKRRLGMTDQ